MNPQESQVKANILTNLTPYTNCWKKRCKPACPFVLSTNGLSKQWFAQSSINLVYLCH